MIGTSARRHKELSVAPFLFNVLLGLICVAAVILIPRHFIKPRKNGYFCNDESIKYPYQSDIVPTKYLIAVLCVYPVILIILTELYRSRYITELFSWKGYNISQVFSNFCKYYAYYLLALLLTLTIAQVAKHATGRLRPTFIDVCKPSLQKTMDNPCRDNSNQFIQDYKCRNADAGAVRQGRLSFFSAHAALSLASAAFCLVYLQARIPRVKCAIVVRSLLQTALLCSGFYIGYTRLLDKHHHLNDVIVGYVAGALIGYLTARYIAYLQTTSTKVEHVVDDIPFIDDDEEEDPARYKTSVVRIEPTELRIFQ